jgi:iron(III) transport system ATP-binding protein
VEIRAEGITKRFGETVALAPTNLTITEGEFVSLLGPSGCGKTTLLRSIAGLEEPDAGHIALGERVVFDSTTRTNLAPEDRGVGMVFQDFALWPHMTVFENVAFGLRARRERGFWRSLRFWQNRADSQNGDDTSQPARLDPKGIADRVHWALSKVRLQDFADRYPTQLSGGQKQRVSFARAIATGPKLLLLDEPLSALDAILREELRLELAALVREIDMTALYVTHDQAEAMSLSDRIAVMNGGQILQTGTPESLYNRPADAFVAKFVGRSNAVSLNGQDQMVRPERIRLAKRDAQDMEFAGIVRQVAFQGDRYEVMLELDADRFWISYLPHKPSVGENLTLYVHPNDMHQIDTQPIDIRQVQFVNQHFHLQNHATQH